MQFQALCAVRQQSLLQRRAKIAAQHENAAGAGDVRRALSGLTAALLRGKKA
jgi:hypothetical protein